jgi:hypothetical protein
MGLWGRLNKENPSQMTQVFFVAGKDQISNFLEGYEFLVELWLFVKRDQD